MINKKIHGYKIDKKQFNKHLKIIIKNIIIKYKEYKEK